MVDAVAALNLSLAHEANLLASSASRISVIPAVVVSGFLGSGKSTLVQHLLRNRGALRIAVLVNEVGQVDIDSQLLNIKQSNAVVGVPAADLAGGCMCCVMHHQLQTALACVHGSDSQPDCLVLETSGVGDPEALAAALRSAGFRLDAIVTVVDAEAAQHTLQLPIAQQQVRLADIIVLNKCDLASLSQLADLEDRIHSMVPDVRTVVRARFGQVPLPLVLDVQPACMQPAHDPAAAPHDQGTAAEAHTSGHTSATSTQPGAPTEGSHGFISHEAPVASGTVLQVAGLGAQLRQRRPPRIEQLQQQQQQPQQQQQLQIEQELHSSQLQDQHLHHHHAHPSGHRHDVHEPQGLEADRGQGPSNTMHTTSAAAHAGHTHAQLHEGFHTRSVTVTDAPLAMAPLQHFLTQHLLKVPGLLRAKGVVWLRERRSQRFVLHFSGRQRAECCSETPWEGPPMTQLVFIGTDEAVLQRLAADITQLSKLGPSHADKMQQAFGAHRSQLQMGDVMTTAPLAAAPAMVPAVPGPVTGKQGQLLASVPSSLPPADVLTAIGGAGCWDPRLQLLQAQPCAGWALDSCACLPDQSDEPAAAGAHGNAASGCGLLKDSPKALLITFSAMDALLHGVVGAEVNAALMLAINRTGQAFTFGVRVAGAISAATLLQKADRVTSLMLAVPDGGSCSGTPGLWQVVQAAAEPVLRKAFRNVVHCNCDATSH